MPGPPKSYHPRGWPWFPGQPPRKKRVPGAIGLALPGQADPFRTGRPCSSSSSRPSGWPWSGVELAGVELLEQLVELAGVELLVELGGVELLVELAGELLVELAGVEPLVELVELAGVEPLVELAGVELLGRMDGGSLDRADRRAAIWASACACSSLSASTLSDSRPSRPSSPSRGWPCSSSSSRASRASGWPCSSSSSRASGWPCSSSSSSWRVELVDVRVELDEQLDEPAGRDELDELDPPSTSSTRATSTR